MMTVFFTMIRKEANVHVISREIAMNEMLQLEINVYVVCAKGDFCLTPNSTAGFLYLFN